MLVTQLENVLAAIHHTLTVIAALMLVQSILLLTLLVLTACKKA